MSGNNNKMPPPAPVAAAPAAEAGDLERVLELMVKRSRGEASNAQVEEAVSKVVKVIGAGANGGQRQAKPKDGTGDSSSNKKLPPRKNNTIQQDEGNYDDDDDEEEEEEESSSLKNQKPSASKPHDEIVDEDDYIPDEDLEEAYQEKISHIPMAKMGAQMMTTFGDHPMPDVKALEAALLGTRKCLQVAMFDARALRRHNKLSFDKAKDNVAVKRRKGPAPPDALVQVEHQYRVLSVHDKLSYDPKCGFDIEELNQLYPEEMRSYSRWKNMHESYKKNASEEPNEEEAIEEDDDGDADGGDKEDSNDADDDNDETGDAAKDETVEEADVGIVATGHLKERAANFDHRTYLMKKDWYLQFAKVRQGSFLPKTTKYTNNSSEQDWENSRTKSRGRPVSGSWDNMSAATVQFLHWLGFQPPAMPAPDQETSQVLAFLGYNFLGRIVEKAIFLRNDAKVAKKKGDRDSEEDMIMVELGPKEKLTEADIHRAMEDPDVKPVQLYSGEKLGMPTTQLYFGPGFEERLEIELETMLNENKQANDAKEEEARKKEAELLATISNPPENCDLDEISRLAGKTVPDFREPTKPSKRKKLLPNPNGEPRKRGRPRKIKPAEDGNENKTPKKRGRPPKVKSDGDNTTAADGETPKKKRGRPPKAKTNTKRGRPPKANSNGNAASKDSSSQEGSGKKRGRPPKDKSKV